MKTKYHFSVPDQKRVRMIVHTDCKNETDDQFALVHHLLTPKFIVKGIVAGHFDLGGKMYKSGRSASASLDEVNNPDFFDEIEAPCIDYDDMSYHFGQTGRKIRVYNTINPRLILDDMFAKIRINFGS